MDELGRSEIQGQAVFLNVQMHLWPRDQLAMETGEQKRGGVTGMKRKTGMSFQEHVEVGKKLRHINDELSGLKALLGQRYPRQLANRAARARDICDSLCSLLDERLFFEHAGRERKGVYYG